MGEANQDGVSVHDFDRIIDEKERLFSEDSRRVRWYGQHWADADGCLSPVKIMLAFAYAALKGGATPAFASTNDLAQEISLIANRNDLRLEARGGRGREDNATNYDTQFFANAITLRSHPPRERCEAIIELIAKVVEPKFAAMNRSGVQLSEITKLEFHRPSECLSKVLGSITLHSGHTTPQAPKPHIADLFMVPPPRDFDETLAQDAKAALADLQSPVGPRLLQFWGPEQSGKLSRIQHLLALLPDRHVKVSGSSRLPILALAVDALAPFEFVDSVHAFYRTAKFSYALTPNLSLAAKLEEIRVLAKEFPALVIVVDLDSIREHEIVRSLHRDHVGHVLLDILHGHDDTRVLVTTTTTSSAFEPFLHGLAKPIKCQPQISICYDTFVQKGQVRKSEGSATPLVVRRLTVRLAQSIGKMIDRCNAEPTERFVLQRQRNICFHADDQIALISFVWRELLSPEERFVFGLISASHDGLRESVVRRMAAAAARAHAKLADVASFDVEGLRDKLCDLLSRRLMRRDAGQLAIGEPEEEYLYFVDRKWRPLVLAAFFEDSGGEPARLAHWLIAREAADQAGAAALRWGHTVDKSDLLGRDIQCLHALIASIDPVQVTSSDSGGVPDADLLAPLEMQVEPPPARDALRFCYFQLYQDIEDDQLANDSVWHNAELRLAILLPLFAPGLPGLSVARLELKGSWTSYGHLRRAFSNRELAALLTSISLAAKRLQRFDIVCATARLADAILLEETSTPPADLLRVFRAEIDMGLFVSGNPESVLLRGMQWPFAPGAAKNLFNGSPAAYDIGSERAFQTRMSDVIARITTLLEGPFAGASDSSTQFLWARGKLFARLGEAYHLAGALDNARSAFETAKRTGDALRHANDESTRSGVPPSVSPVLGGRGTRAYIRFLLDDAHRTTCASVPPLRDSERDVRLPPLSRLAPDDGNLALARRLQLDSVLRLRRRKTADSVGTMIDDARIACAYGDYATTLQRLDEAAEAPFHPGSSTEVLLELATVRTRYAIECLRWLSQLPSEHLTADAEQLRVLAKYLKPGATDVHLPTVLLGRTKEYHKTFWEMVKEYPPGFRYRTYARLTQGWIGALSANEHRSAVKGGETKELLASALRCVESAIREMRESGYQMHLSEAESLRGCLSNLK